MANEVQIEISLEEKQALDALTKLIKKTDEFTNDFQKGAKESSRSWDVFTGVLTGNLATKAIGAVTDASKALFRTFIVDGIKAAQVQEDAINKLNTALQITGFNVPKASAEFQKFASEIQQVTKFGDELIIENIALLQSLGNLSEKGLKDGTRAALDLSAALGISLDSAITLVGKAAAGEISSFTRYGVVIEKGKNNAETFANTLEALNSKFGGSAEAQVSTYSGRVAQLSNSFGDLQEEFGKIVTENDSVAGAIGDLNSVIVNFSEYIKSNGPQIASSLREITDTFLITPAKFWIDFFGDKKPTGLTEINAELEQIQVSLKSLDLKKNAFMDGIGSKNQSEKDFIESKMVELLDREQVLLNARNDLAKTSTESDSPSASSPLEKAVSPSEAADVVFEKEKQAIISQLKSDARAIEAEQKLIAQEDEFASNEERLANIENQLMLENELKTTMDQANLAEQAKTKEDLQKVEDNAKKINLEKEKRFLTEREKLRMEDVQREMQYRNTLTGIANNFLNASIALTRQGTSAMKGLQSAQSLINTYTAATNALADTRPAFLAPAAAASIVAVGLANVAKINGVGGFQTGGFVGGNSIAGDQNLIRANSDEFVATRAQQRNLIETIANGSLSNQGGVNNDQMASIMNQPIIVQVDGREIARATRGARKEGYQI